MKILNVNTSDIRGGAARAAYRLHRSLITEGINSQMLVQSKFSGDYTVIGPATKASKITGFLRTELDRLPLYRYKNRTSALFSPAWIPFSNVAQKINSFKPDIVHLHWINSGMLRPEDLSKINVPIIWSLHDMWAFSGGCHYDVECGRYKNECGQCPVLGSFKNNDLASKVFNRKMRSYSKIGSLTVIGLSMWLKLCAESSPVFSKANVVNLPNPINTESYQPFDKVKARELHNLPQDKKLILFGAISGTSDPRKGFSELSDALLTIDSEDTELVVFGSDQPKESLGFKQKVYYLGRIYDDVTLRLIYSAADVMVVSSLQENLSNAIMESLACGTPVVGFDIGGNSDMIIHKRNGYLAKPLNVSDLAKGIAWVLNKSEYKKLSENARRGVINKFDSKLIANKYIKLYNEILNKKQ